MDFLRHVSSNAIHTYSVCARARIHLPAPNPQLYLGQLGQGRSGWKKTTTVSRRHVCHTVARLWWRRRQQRRHDIAKTPRTHSLQSLPRHQRVQLTRRRTVNAIESVRLLQSISTAFWGTICIRPQFERKGCYICIRMRE